MPTVYCSEQLGGGRPSNLRLPLGIGLTCWNIYGSSPSVPLFHLRSRLCRPLDKMSAFNLLRLSALLAVAFSVTAQTAPLYSQCGGIDYAGSTACPLGTVCEELNAYYYQCLPGTSTASTSTSTSDGVTPEGGYAVYPTDTLNPLQATAAADLKVARG